jgi:hypothetical protein
MLKKTTSNGSKIDLSQALLQGRSSIVIGPFFSPLVPPFTSFFRVEFAKGIAFDWERL